MGKHGREIYSYSREVGYDLKIEYNGDGLELYIGRANPGSATSSAVWQIYKMEYDGSNRPITRRYANGSDDFKNAWEDRSTYDYKGIWRT